MNDLELADAYDAAADHMEVHGWCTYALCNEAGEVCVSGALAAVMNPRVLDRSLSWADRIAGPRYTDWVDAVRELGEHHLPADAEYRNAVNWNNVEAEDRFEVIDVLRGAAKTLRGAS